MRQLIDERGFSDIGTAYEGEFGQPVLGTMLQIGAADDKTGGFDGHKDDILDLSRGRLTAAAQPKSRVSQQTVEHQQFISQGIIQEMGADILDSRAQDR